jgi:hypothetical protein
MKKWTTGGAMTRALPVVAFSARYFTVHQTQGCR